MSKKDEESKVLKKLEDLEKRIDDRIDKVETSLKKIEKSSGLSTEDQLFFGIAFSLFVLFLQLPDVGTILESFGVVVEPARGIITTNMVLISFLLFASVARYLAVLTETDKQKNKWRLHSVSFLLCCPYFLIADFTIRIFTPLLTSVHFFLSLLSPITLLAISFVIGYYVEKRWYNLYGGKRAHISFIFGYLGAVIFFAYYLAIVTSLIIPISDLVAIIILISSAFLVYLLIKFNEFLEKRLKKPKEV